MSIALHETVVVPFGKTEPEAGVHEVVTPGQLSFAVVVKLTIAVQTPASVDCVILAGQVSVGGVTSLTVTEKVQEVVLPMPSVAVQVTLVAPFGKAYPGAGLQTVFTVEQLSVAVGGV